MRRLGWRRLFALVAVMALVAGACGDDDEEEAEDEGTEEEFDGTLVVATEYEFDAPDELHASTVDFRFRNDGNVAHEMALTKIGDRTTDEVFEELGPFFDATESDEIEGPPLPDVFFDGLTGIGDTQPGDDPVDSELTMTEGTWLLLCSLTDADTESDEDEGGGGGGGGGEDEPAGRAQGEEEEGEEPDLPRHYESGMFKVIEVTGATQPEFPEADSTVTISDYTFEADLEAGDQTIAVNNEGDQIHHVVAFDFGEGVEPADAEAQFKELVQQVFGGGGGGGGAEEEPPGRAQGEEDEEEAPPEGEEGGPPGGEPEEVFSTFVFTPGYGGTVEAELEAGHTYVLACFISDREGGQPHALAHDMFKAFPIT